MGGKPRPVDEPPEFGHGTGELLDDVDGRKPEIGDSIGSTFDDPSSF
jgi:hypothetical protein